MTEMELVERLADVESRAKSNTHRLDKLELQSNAIHSLATAVSVMAEGQKHQGETIDRVASQVQSLDGKLDAIENTPAQRWDTVVKAGITAVCSIIVGFLLAQAGIVN